MCSSLHYLARTSSTSVTMYHNRGDNTSLCEHPLETATCILTLVNLFCFYLGTMKHVFHPITNSVFYSTAFDRSYYKPKWGVIKTIFYVYEEMLLTKFLGHWKLDYGYVIEIWRHGKAVPSDGESFLTGTISFHFGNGRIFQWRKIHRDSFDMTRQARISTGMHWISIWIARACSPTAQYETGRGDFLWDWSLSRTHLLNEITIDVFAKLNPGWLKATKSRELKCHRSHLFVLSLGMIPPMKGKIKKKNVVIKKKEWLSSN